MRRRLMIQMDDELLREAGQQAARSGRNLDDVIEDALRELLAQQRMATTRKPVRLITAKGQGLLPGVNLDHSAGLLDMMDTPNRRD